MIFQSYLNRFHNMLAVGLLVLALMVLGVWMHSLYSIETTSIAQTNANNDPDYYMDNVVVNGRNIDGYRYRIEAERLVYYSSRNGSLLERPRVAEFRQNELVKRIAANRGWLDDDEQLLTLSDNVQIQHQNSGQTNSISAASQLIINLRKPAERS